MAETMTTDTEPFASSFYHMTKLEARDLFDDLEDLRTGDSDEDILDIEKLISIQKRMGGYGDDAGLW